MKKYFSKRWFSNLLIVLFGLVILLIAGLVSYKTFFMSASDNNLFIGDGNDAQLKFVYTPGVIAPPDRGYRVADIAGSGLPFLEIFDQNEITAVMGSQTRDHPVYVIPYRYVISSQSRLMAIVPLPPYDYTYNRLANNSSPAYKFLTWARDKSTKINIPSERTDLASAVDAYNKAVLLSSSTFLIDSTKQLVLTNDKYVVGSAGGSAPNDPDVAPAIIVGTGQDPYDALAVSIDPNIHYKQPSNNSLALKVLYSASSEATRVGDSSAKTKIDAAIANYRRQIQSSVSSSGLTISSVATIRNKESQTVGFAVDLAGLTMTDAALRRVLFNIDEKTFCDIGFSGETNQLSADSQNCIWDSSNLHGSFTWDASTGQDVGTDVPGTRTLKLKAFSTASGNNEFGSVSKTVTVLPGTGEVATPGGGVVPMSVTVPQSVDQSNTKLTKEVPIKISASNLNPNGVDGPNRVGKISWFVCDKDQQTVLSSISEGCEEKEKFGEFQQNSFTDKIVYWDASGSAPGTHTIMLKVFSMKNDAGIFPDYPGATKVVSSNITVVKSMADAGGDGSGGVNDNAPTGSITPDWAANFQQSKTIKTIQDIISRIGSFTLLILAILAVLAIIIAGMKYITSAGDPKGAETGKKAILFTVYGIAIAVLSIQLIQITISEIQKIVGDRLPSPDQPDKFLLPGFGGTNASVYSIIGHDSGFIWRVIQLAVYYAEAVAFFYILYASFIYITSFGDDSKAESGKKTLIWAVIGLALVISANFLLNTFGKLIA